MNFDDQPVGQHNEFLISEHPDPTSEEASVQPKEVSPLPDRLLNKDTKTRLNAMIELLNLFTSQPDSSTFMEYLPNFPKYLADTHPKVQEKATEAFSVLLAHCPPEAEKALNDSLSSLIEKALSSAKTQVKGKALECIVDLAERPSTHEMLKELLKGSLGKKVAPKISAPAVQAVSKLLATYGSKYFPVEEFVGLIAGLADSTNDKVRMESLAYLKEGYRWNKTSVENAIKGLKKAQQEELNKQFAEITEQPKPLKIIKGGETETVDVSKKKKEKHVDSYASATEVSVLKKYGDQWCSQVMAINKWDEKRDKLEDLLKAISVEKIKNENFTELGKTLELLLDNSNITVVNTVLKIIGQLAKGLRSNFANYSRKAFKAIVQKFKDNKTVVEAQKCMDNLVFSLKLENMIEQIKETLGDKSPHIKTKVCLWIEQSVLSKANTSLLKLMGTELGPVLVKLTSDAISDVRESALSCLRAMQPLLQDDTAFSTLMTELNKQKKEKVSKVSAKSKETEEKKVKKPKDSSESIEPSSKIPKMHEPRKELVKKDTLKRSSTAPRHMMSKLVEKIKKEEVETLTEEDTGVLPLEEANKQVTESIPSEITALLEMKEWKERQKGIVELKAWVESNRDKTQELLEAISIWVKVKLKNFKESNQGIMKECYILLQTMADTCVTTKRFAVIIVPALVERMNDAKCVETCVNIILSISDSVNPSYISTLVLKNAQSTKNLNMIKGVITLLMKMLEGYGGNLLPLKQSVDYVKNYLSHANAQVRTNAIHYIVQVYEVIGEAINGWLGTDLKESVYKVLQTEFGKVKPSHSSEVKRTLKGESADFAAKNKKKDVLDSLMPRVNISSQITSKLLANLSDSSMKVRQEAKESIEKILFASNNRILPSGLSPLIIALKGRMSEPCKNLAKEFIALIGSLASAIGPSFRQYHKQIVQPLLFNLSDKQAAIRNETVIAIDKIAELGPDLILSNVPPLLEKGNPELRTTLLAWMLKNKESFGKCDCQSFVKPLVVVMQDKSKEIRAMAEQVVEVIIENVGYGAFESAIQDLKPVVKESLETVLNKYKPNLITKSKQDETQDKVEANKDEVENEMSEQLIIELEGVSKEPEKTNDNSAQHEHKEDNKTEATDVIENTVEEKVTEDKSARLKNNEVITKSNIVCEDAKISNEKSKQIRPIENECSKSNKVKEVEMNSTEAKENNIAQPTPIKANVNTKIPHKKERVPLISSKSVMNNAKTISKDNSIPCDTQADNSVRLSLQKSNTLAESELDIVTSPAKQFVKIEMPTCRSTNDLMKRFESRRMLKAKEVKKISRKVNRTRIKHITQSPEYSQTNAIQHDINSEHLIVALIGNKERRAKADRTLKWPINEIREDYVEKLKKALKNVIRHDLFDAMFSTQFKKNISALNLLAEGLNNELDSLIDITDILFKWLVTKLVDQSNTAITKTIFVFLTKFFKAMEEKNYYMLDFEAASILPMLCERLGAGNAGLRQQVKDLLKQILVVYTPTKLAGHVLNTVEITKNQKTKIECIELLRELSGKHGVNKIYPSKYIKTFGKLVLSQDNTLKNVSIEVLADIYKVYGDSIWTLVGEMSEKHKEMLRNRFSLISLTESVHSSNSSKRPVTPNIEFTGTSASIGSQDKLHHGATAKKKTKITSKDNSKAEESSIIDDSKAKTPILKQMSSSAIPLINEQCDELLETNLRFNATSALTMKNKPEDKMNSEKKMEQMQGSITMKIETLEQALRTLKTGDISTQIDALMYINERTISTEEKKVLIDNCDYMLTTFAELLKETFEKPLSEIPVRFAKYFMTVVNKICSSKSIISKIAEQTLYLLAEQLLSKLLFNGLGKMGENNEGDFLVKSFNSTMLRLLENCNPTKSFLVLIRLFTTYKSAPPMIDNIKTGKLPSLIVKCLLKLTKVMGALIHSLDTPRLLLCLHEELTTTPASRTPNDDIGIRLAKTIINDLVKVRGKTILEDYKIIEEHSKPDVHIKRWIHFALKTSHILSSSVTKSCDTTTIHSDESLAELKEIFKQLNSKGGFQDGIASLSNYMARHPEIDLSPYFVSCSRSFKDYVMDALKRSGATTQRGDESVRIEKEEHKTAESTLLEWKNRIALLKQKLDTGKSDTTSSMYKTTDK